MSVQPSEEQIYPASIRIHPAYRISSLHDKITFTVNIFPASQKSV